MESEKTLTGEYVEWLNERLLNSDGTPKKVEELQRMLKDGEIADHVYFELFEALTSLQRDGHYRNSIAYYYALLAERDEEKA